jgi:hypothetical protein
MNKSAGSGGDNPLAELNAYIRGLRPAQPEGELASVRRFRKTWESGETIDRLERSQARAPANAGPLNSHALVLRSLSLMGELSTDYLRRFLVHAEALQWLESVREKYPGGAGEAARKKPSRRSGGMAKRRGRS